MSGARPVGPSGQRGWGAMLSSPPLVTAVVSAALALVLLQWRHYEARTRLRASVSAIENAAAARRHVMRAYLIVRATDAGDPSFSRVDAAAELDRAALAIEDWLAGRSAALAARGPVPTDPVLRALVASYGRDVAAFRTLLDRADGRAAAVDVRTAFGGLEATADSVEFHVASVLAELRAREQRDHALTVFGLTLFVVLAGGGLQYVAERRARAEQALSSSEARLELLLARLPAAVWTTDSALRITAITGGGLAAAGRDPATVVGHAVDEFAPADDATLALAHRRALLGQSATYAVSRRGRAWEARVEPRRDATGAIVGTVGVALDVTERQRMDARLRQAQTLEAMGRLAGGVAHDFNNLLTVVVNHAQFLREELPAGDPRREDVDAIADAAERGARLTQQLLAFGRRQPQQPTRLDLGAIVTDMAPILRRLVGERVRLDLAPAGPAPVVADRSQLEQVLMNLAVNARDAMPDGGALAIAVDHADALVRLTVRDTGHGMDDATRERIFEPFFTTKAPERGTGLGLATVHGIVEQAGGRIDVDSAPGQGTTFTIVLPAADGALPD